MTLTPPASEPVATLTFFMIVFLVVGVIFLFIHLVMGSVIRPNVPEPEKLTIYECGEPTVGSAWVQFDLRYYVVALLFVIFDVEVAFFFPWAMVFGKANQLGNMPESANITQAQKAEQAKLSKDLLPSGVSMKTKEVYGLTTTNSPDGPDGRKKVETTATPITPKAARGWATVAFWDIIIFFGVLMVGFAYVWRRGDLNWVKAVSHRGGDHPVGQEPPQAAA